jgi:hypothetical protein
MSKTRNLFISHLHEDDGYVGRLKTLLEARGYTIRDSSIVNAKPNNAKSPDYIKSGILAPAITWAGTLVVLVSNKTHESEWVDWEVEYAQKSGDTRVVGVWLPGAKDSDLPDSLEKYRDAMVNWDGDAIAEAIDRNDSSVTAGGEPRPPRNIARHKCTR